ncbi:hypothetical protein CEXT_367551, partial [Caerostris extrusa]
MNLRNIFRGKQHFLEKRKCNAQRRRVSSFPEEKTEREKQIRFVLLLVQLFK